jgi:hypothetical protein
VEVVYINKLKVRAFVRIDGEYQNWNDLSSEQQKVIGAALNERALRAIGYVPETELNDDTA